MPEPGSRKRARSVAAFGRGGIDETLMGRPLTDIYKSTGDVGMVKRPRSNGDTGMERRDWQGLRRPVDQLQSFKRGGKVKKTGVYKLHKGEKVLTARAAKTATAAKPAASKRPAAKKTVVRKPVARRR